MPSTVTHAYFVNDVFERLPQRRKEFLIHEKDRMKLSGQSMDALFFYNLTNLKRGKKVRKFGNYFHEHHSFLFFETLIHYIKYNGYIHHPDIMAYLYGMLCHHVLDRTCHPFVIYYCGDYQKEDRSTRKYNSLHGEMETLIDNYFVQEREQVLPWSFDCVSFCFPKISFSEELKEVIDFTFRESFHLSTMSSIYAQSLEQMRFFYQVFRKDTSGMKRLAYLAIDWCSPRSLLHKSALSYHQKVRNKDELLNLKHEKWYHPAKKRITSTESFLDLYLKSIFEVTALIEQIDSYFYDDKNINLKKVLKNLSYKTGLDCDKESELEFFKF